jgi:Chaperone of endosialidase
MLLNYGISVDPSPLPVSTAQTPSQGRVNISASATTAVYCNQIVLAVPVGVDAGSLYTETPGSSVNTNNWSLTAQLRPASQLGLPGDENYATFIYDCQIAQDFLINYNLVFGVLGFVQSTPGDVMLAIQEQSGTTSDPSTFTLKSAQIPLQKSVPQFYMKNFVATVPSSPTVPTAEFQVGSPINFEWESNGTYFQLFAKGSTQPVYAGTATNFQLPAAPATETTYFLVGSVTGDPGQDTPQGGYEPIYLYDALTVTISNPELAPTSIVVGQTLNVTGATTLSATSTGPLTSASANISGALQAGGLAVTGTTSLGDVTSSGTMTVPGQSNLGSLTVTGQTRLGPVAAQAVGVSSLTSTGNLNVTGSVISTNAQIAFGQVIGCNLGDTFSYENLTMSWYSIGWFSDPWFGYGPTAWFSGYGGIKFFTGSLVSATNPAPAFSIDYGGNCRYAVSMSKASSIALKQNVRALTSADAGEILAHLEPVSYTLRAAPQQGTQLGFIAENVHRSVASSDRKAIIPDQILAVLTRVAKEQQATILTLEERIRALEVKYGANSNG